MKVLHSIKNFNITFSLDLNVLRSPEFKKYFWKLGQYICMYAYECMKWVGESSDHCVYILKIKEDLHIYMYGRFHR